MAKKTVQPTATERAMERLRAALDVACRLRGEAMWTNGYRAAKYGGHTEIPGDPEVERLYQKEQAQWRACGPAEKAVLRQAKALARVMASEQP